MKKEEIKEWVKEHKTILIETGLVVGGAVLTVLVTKKFSCHHSNYTLVPKPELSDFEKNAKLIDEEVFTDLAPNIETAVLNKDLDKVVLERSYQLDENELLSKFVTVTVENVYGD